MTRTREEVRNPGGTINAPGLIRVTGVPTSSSDWRMWYATDCCQPSNSLSMIVIDASHFTCVVPYQPGAALPPKECRSG
jgi:hypothetical protein